MKKIVLLVLLAGATAVPSHAAFPGRNGKIAFLGGYYDRGPATGCTEQTWHIYSLETDGSDFRRIDENVESVAGPPAWSPGGKWLTFAGGDGDSASNEIYIANAGGDTQLKVTDNAVMDSYPSWAPNGNKLVFVRGNIRADIWIMKRDGSAQRRVLRSERAEWWPVWSPDGDRIAFARGDLYTIRLDGTGLRRLTHTNGVSGIDWSPDGSRLIYQYATESKTETYIVNRDGTGRRRLDTDLQDLSWSPNGKRLTGTGEAEGEGCGPDLYVSDADGNDERHIPTENLSVYYPAWQAASNRDS